MKLVKIARKDANAEGVLVGNDVKIIGSWRHGRADDSPFTLGGKSLDELNTLLRGSQESVPLSSVVLAVPVDPTAQIICAGVNYREHAGEIKAEAPETPRLFKRTIETLVAHEEAIIRPKVSETFDYEGEIAVVIGGGTHRHVAAKDAMAIVAGYSCFMDGSVREYQKHTVTAGKNFWRSGAMGPWIVTPDEIGRTDIALQTFIDGERLQTARASEMIFSIAEIIAYITKITVLRAGDVIATGTPGGVGSRKTPPRWLKPGEVVEVDVEAVGRLRNRVEDEG